MKGASSIIVAIMLMLAIIAMISFAFVFFGRIEQKTTAAAEEEAGRFVGDITSFRIDAVDNGNLYIRNLDVKLIDSGNISLYVDRQPVSIAADKNLSPGITSTINISDGVLAAGTYDFKLTTRLMEITQSVDVPKNNIVKDPRFGEGGSRSPLDIVMIIDKSLSMGSISGNPTRLALAKNASKNFVDMTGEQDDISVVSFSTTATLDQGLTFDKTLVKNKIDSINTVMWTAIGAGIYTATVELTSSRSRAEARKIEILLTDGSETENTHPLERAAEAAANGITIYTIGFGSGTDPNTGINESLLKNISDITGGKYYYAATGPELNDVFTDIGEEIGINWVKTGNTTIGDYGLSCSSPGICAVFSNTVYPDSAVYQDTKLVFPGSFVVEASANAFVSGTMYSGQCSKLAGENCTKNDARMRLIALDSAGNILNHAASPWGSASGSGWVRITETWTTPPNTKTVRLQVEPGDCSAACSVTGVYVDDADMKISKA